MKEFQLYINTIKSIIDTFHEKETVFYNDGEWYSREHCRNLSSEELTGWALSLINFDA